MQTGGLIPSWWERCILIFITSNVKSIKIAIVFFTICSFNLFQEVKSWLWISWLSVHPPARTPWCSRASAPTVWLADTSAPLEHPALTSSPSSAPRAASSNVPVVADSPADTRSKQERTRVPTTSFFSANSWSSFKYIVTKYLLLCENTNFRFKTDENWLFIKQRLSCGFLGF